ncbi:type VI secretion system baseplate subunit TssG [Roseibium denhamense]|uniref:Type VI secretion system protein ImpH n=1 Tax=Roseibium denhamense TaxID=76305 RepID=A0ABY1NR28_9HYPH|nr:type VI secretion system baseplate subunit TssG [Roseibium denhamense]SMP15818.1 type VI secretion system protein ImpH [Roseibium denhamense]
MTASSDTPDPDANKTRVDATDRAEALDKTVIRPGKSAFPWPEPPETESDPFQSPEPPIKSHEILSPVDVDASDPRLDELPALSDTIKSTSADTPVTEDTEITSAFDSAPQTDAVVAVGRAADSEPSADQDEEHGAEDFATPEPAPRIEVPVQKQYASLLATLGAQIESNPGGYDLLAVLRMLEGQTAPVKDHTGEPGNSPTQAAPVPPRIGKSQRLMEDIVRFGQDPSSEFAPSTIERAMRDQQDGLVFMERFLGMLGPHGALPSAMTDEAIMRGLRGDDSFPRFLDVFNNRFVQLFFRAWADARPIAQHDRPDDDRFLNYLGSAIGIGAPIYRDLDRIDDRLKLLYAGLTSPKAKSAARLKALISGVFGVRVEIEQCVGSWLQLDPDDQLAVGGNGLGGAGRLGRDTIVGARVYSVSDKIRIRIYTKDLSEYRKFLPPTRTKPNEWTEKLFDLIEFYLGLEIEYEIELALPRHCASAICMNRSASATLGHIGWLKPPHGESDAPGDDSPADDILTDTRFRPIRRHTTVYQ